MQRIALLGLLVIVVGVILLGATGQLVSAKEWVANLIPIGEGAKGKPVAERPRIQEPSQTSIERAEISQSTANPQPTPIPDIPKSQVTPVNQPVVNPRFVSYQEILDDPRIDKSALSGIQAICYVKWPNDDEVKIYVSHRGQHLIFFRFPEDWTVMGCYSPNPGSWQAILEGNGWIMWTFNIKNQGG